MGLAEGGLGNAEASLVYQIEPWSTQGRGQRSPPGVPPASGPHTLQGKGPLDFLHRLRTHSRRTSCQMGRELQRAELQEAEPVGEINTQDSSVCAQQVSSKPRMPLGQG